MDYDDGPNTPASYGRRTGRSRVFTSPFRSPTQSNIPNVLSDVGGSLPVRLLSSDRALRLGPSTKPRYVVRAAARPHMGMSPTSHSTDRWDPVSLSRPSHVLYDDSIDSWYDHQSPRASTAAAYRSPSFSVLSQAALAPITALIHNRSVVDASHAVNITSPYHCHGQKNHLAPIESAFCTAMGIITHTSTSQRGKHLHTVKSCSADEPAFVHNGIECVGGEDVALLEQIPDIPLAQHSQRLAIHEAMSAPPPPPTTRSHRRRSVLAATPPPGPNVRTRSQSREGEWRPLHAPPVPTQRPSSRVRDQSSPPPQPVAIATKQHNTKTGRSSAVRVAASHAMSTYASAADVSQVARQEQLLRSLDGFYCDEDSTGMTTDTTAAGVVFLATDVVLSRTDSSEYPVSGVLSISTAVLAGAERLAGVGRARHRGVSAHIIAEQGVAATRDVEGTVVGMSAANDVMSDRIVTRSRVDTSGQLSTFSSSSSSLFEPRGEDMTPGDADLHTPTATRTRSHAATDTATASHPHTPRTRTSSPSSTAPTSSTYASTATSRSTKRSRHAMEEIDDIDVEAHRRDRWERHTPANTILLAARGGARARQSVTAMPEVAVDAVLSTPRSDGFISASALLAASRSASNASSNRGYDSSAICASLSVTGSGIHNDTPRNGSPRNGSSRTFAVTPAYSATAHASTPSSTTPYHTSTSSPAPIAVPTQTPIVAAPSSLSTSQPRGSATQPSIDHLLQNRPTIPLPPPPPNLSHRGSPILPSPSPLTSRDGLTYPESRASMHIARAVDTCASSHPSLRTTATRVIASAMSVSTSTPSRVPPSLPPPPPPPSAPLRPPAPIPAPAPVTAPLSPHPAPVSPFHHRPASCPPPSDHPLHTPPPSLPPPTPPYPTAFPFASTPAVPLSAPRPHTQSSSPHRDIQASAHTETHARSIVIAIPAPATSQLSLVYAQRPAAHTATPTTRSPPRHTATTTHTPASLARGSTFPATPMPTPVTVLPLSPLSARQRTRTRARREVDMTVSDNIDNSIHSSTRADAAANAALGANVHGPNNIEASVCGSRADVAHTEGVCAAGEGTERRGQDGRADSSVWDGERRGVRGMDGAQRQGQGEGREEGRDGSGGDGADSNGMGKDGDSGGDVQTSRIITPCPHATSATCSTSSSSCSNVCAATTQTTTDFPNVLITPARHRRVSACSPGFTPSSNNSTANVPAMSPSTPAFRYHLLAPSTPPPVARTRATHSPTHAATSTATPSTLATTALMSTTAAATPSIRPLSSPFTPRILPPQHPHALSSPDPFRFLSPVQSPPRAARNTIQPSKSSQSVAPSQPLRTPLGPPAPILPPQEVVPSRATLLNMPSLSLTTAYHSRVLNTNSIYTPDIVSTNFTFDPASAPTPMLTDNNVMNSPPRSPLVFSPFSPTSVLASPTPFNPLYSVSPVTLYQAPLPDDYYLNLLAWQPSRFLALAHGSHVSILAPPHPERLKEIQLAMNTQICSLAWSSDTILHIGARDGHVLTVDLEADAVIRVDRAHTVRVGTLQACRTSPHLLLSGSADCSLVVTDMRAPPATPWSVAVRDESFGILSPASIPSVAFLFRGHRQEVCGASWSAANPNLIASGSNDNHVGIWDLRRGMWMRRVHRAGVKALAWHEDMLITAGGTNDKRVVLWRYGAGFVDMHAPADAELNLFEPDTFDNRAEVGRGGAMLGPLSFQGEVHASSQVCGVVWVGDIPVTSHGFTQNCIATWNTRPLAMRTRITAHARRALYIAGDGKSLVATGAGDATVKVWRIGENRDVASVGAGIGGHHTDCGSDTWIDPDRKKASFGCSLRLR